MIVYNVIITKLADRDEKAIFTYIKEEFGEIYALKFREKLIKIFETLSKYPFIGRMAKNDNSLRVYILSKQNKIVYKIRESEVIIIRLLNMKTKLSGKY